MRQQIKATLILALFSFGALLSIGLALDWFGPGARKISVSREYMVVREDGLVRVQTTVSASSKNAFMVGEPVTLSVNTLVLRTDAELVPNDKDLTVKLDWVIPQSYKQSKEAEINWRKWQIKNSGENGIAWLKLPRREGIDPVQLLMTEKELKNSVYYSDGAIENRRHLSIDQRMVTPFQTTTLVYDTSGPKAVGIEILGDTAPLFDQTLEPLFEVESSSVAVQILIAKIGLVLAVFFGLLAVVPLLENLDSHFVVLTSMLKGIFQKTSRLKRS